MWPGHYDGPAHADGTPEDHCRDATTLPLIRAAIEHGVPLLAICRGMQELNVALGAARPAASRTCLRRWTNSTPSDQPIPRVRTGKARGVRIEADAGALARCSPCSARCPPYRHQLHNQGVQRLAPRLVAEAWAPDGTVEAVRVEGAKAFAMYAQWHPEYDWDHDADSRAIFLAFGSFAPRIGRRATASRASRRRLNSRREDAGDAHHPSIANCLLLPAPRRANVGSPARNMPVVEFRCPLPARPTIPIGIKYGARSPPDYRAFVQREPDHRPNT